MDGDSASVDIHGAGLAETLVRGHLARERVQRGELHLIVECQGYATVRVDGVLRSEVDRVRGILAE